MSEKSFLVYISCVGEQDPVSEKTQEDGALLTCFRYLVEVEKLHFNTAYLIPTSKKLTPQRHTEDKAKECKSKMQEMHPNTQQITIVPLEVKNPADLRQVYPNMRELLKCIIRDVENQSQNASITFHINVSSGTPQMKESISFLVSTGHLDPYEVRLWQVFDPRGGAVEISERVQHAPELDLLSQERVLYHLEQLTKQHLYQEANNCLRRGLMVAYLDFAKELYKVLAEHDQWLYKAAYNDLKRVLSIGQVPNFLQGWLNEVLNWLKELAQNSPPKEILAIDRYYCAERRRKNSLYPDAINHFWTACELALEKHGEEIRVFDPREFISAFKLIELISAFPSPLRRKFVKLRGRENTPLLEVVDWLRRIRNEVEHSLRPVDKKLAENALETAKELLEALGWGGKMQNCPLRPELVEEKLSELIRAMRDSLWR